MALPMEVAVCLGGAGCNAITRVKGKGITGSKLDAVNKYLTHHRISKTNYSFAYCKFGLTSQVNFLQSQLNKTSEGIFSIKTKCHQSG
jgi:hypothetical protein